MFDRLSQDARYAARALKRSPLFTMVAVLSIAIGVGATTAIVTLASTLLLRPPPGVGNPERVVTLGRTQDGRGFDNMSYPNFLDYRAAASLASLAAIRLDPNAVSLAGASGGEPVQASAVSGNFFDVLQARPSRGRFFLPDEDSIPGARPVAVLSHGFWRTRFNSADSVIGGKIVLNGTPFTVVGVAAEGFQGPFVVAPDLWVPVMSSTLIGFTENTLRNRQAVWLIGIGRLASNASLNAAQVELGAIAARQLKDYPEQNRGKGVRVTPASLLPGDLRGLVAGFMAMLFFVASLVLVIASTNVAGMLLARATARQREIAVRLALGASRAQLVRQLVIESLVLFVMAGAAGVFLANWLVSGLMALIPRLPVQLAFDPRIDWRVLVFALAASLITGLIAGVVPALQTTQPALVPALKSDAASGRRQRLRSSLLVSQIAFSMLLLIVAGLFARTLARARSIDPGFDPANVHVASMDFELARYDSLRGRQLGATMLEEVRRLPEVESAALSAMLPLGGGGLGMGDVEVPGRPAPDERNGWRLDWNVVTPGYFATMKMRLVAGREFTLADRTGAQRVAILNETFAKNAFPDQSAVGRTIMINDRETIVVGVARDAKYRSLGEQPRNFIYVPFEQIYIGRINLMVRSAPGTQPAGGMRRIVARLDPALPILNQQPLEDLAATSLFPQRVALYVAGSLGAVALLLALLGIYGVIAYSVTQRTREIGVRVALGAHRSHVVGLVLRQGLVLAGIGVVIGALAGVGITRTMRSLLYGVPPTDVIAFAGAAVLLALAAAVASFIPARRAAGVDPMIALRSE